MENKQFFDPYNFNSVPASNTTSQTNMTEDMTFKPAMELSPTMFYQQQYWYYNYLTKMLDYKIKLKEYENLNKGKN